MSEPVTFGGGIAITNGRAAPRAGAGASAAPAGASAPSGRNTPRSSQNEYQCDSTRAGS